MLVAVTSAILQATAGIFSTAVTRVLAGRNFHVWSSLHSSVVSQSMLRAVEASRVSGVAREAVKQSRKVRSAIGQSLHK